MCESVPVEWQKRDILDAYNHRDNRFHRHIFSKGIAQEGHESGDDIGRIQSAALDEREYD